MASKLANTISVVKFLQLLLPSVYMGGMKCKFGTDLTRSLFEVFDSFHFLYSFKIVMFKTSFNLLPFFHLSIKSLCLSLSHYLCVTMMVFWSL